jgi:hypothetical protein
MALLAIDVPSGEHHMTVRFENTLAEQVATIVSLASLAAVLATLVVTRQWRAVVAGLVICLLLASVTAWHVYSSPSVQRPVSVEGNLGNQIKLLGYNLDEKSYRPGDTVNVTLYWLALSDMDQDYKVFVHLTDEAETRLIAQSDRWPVYNFSPTTRWEPGEIVWDRHEIQIPLDEAPGTYRLAAGAYLLETMRNLDVLDQNGNPLGVRVPLGTVEIEP